MSDLRSDRASRPAPGGVEPPAGNPRRLITAGIALGAVAAFGIGIWFAYDQGVKRGASGAPPLIRADQGPAKVAPENPGGMQVPNQDKQIYERIGSNAAQAPAAPTERLLPPPERATAAPTQAVPVAPRPAPPPVPNRTDAPTGTPLQTPAPSQPVTSASRPGQPQSVVPPRAAGSSPAATATTAPSPAPASAPAPAATAAPAAPAPATPAVAATPGGTARIQLASLKDQAAAQATWTQLQRRFPDVLGGLQPTFERVDIADKGTFIRLQAGPLKDRAAAQAACQLLAAKNQGCIVVGR